MTATFTPVSAPEQDRHNLIALVAEIERAQQQEDVEGFLSLFAPTAVWVNGAGRRLIGLEEISEFTRRVLPGAMAGGSVTYEVEHIAFITPDVALTGVRQQYLDAAGKPLAEDGAGSPSYLWSRTDGTWKIVAGQNTAVSDGR
ncbi:SgcJ/EcaC family oxidoreductase [Actinoplanes sp. NPDC048791]|uniref:SgcJ/EcaC family oxidoreductase n=1 Tax=Actinoplanes sp. NPDC048791 TaxID=3154623 RepID=UPI0033E2A332